MAGVGDADRFESADLTPGFLKGLYCPLFCYFYLFYVSLDRFVYPGSELL